MYTSVLELVQEIKSAKTESERISLIQNHAKTNRHFVTFLWYAFFNPKKPSFVTIPEYRQNMSDVSFTYIKIEKAIGWLKFFFEGDSFIANEKKRTDRLLSILEEISWKETYAYESLVLNNYRDEIMTKELVLKALPDFETNHVEVR